MAKDKVFDYDSLQHYEAGSFNRYFRTVLTDKVIEMEREPLHNDEICSFLNKEYHTYKLISNCILYRVYGNICALSPNEKVTKGANVRGRYASTEFAESYVDAKTRLALDLRWLNTKMYEAKINVPAGTVINSGIVAPVKVKGGSTLPGGAEQIILPKDWPREWIIGYRRVTTLQLHEEPDFSLSEPNGIDDRENLYPSRCPVCGCKFFREIPKNERFCYYGSKGNLYCTVYQCLNPKCLLNW